MFDALDVTLITFEYAVNDSHAVTFVELRAILSQILKTRVLNVAGFMNGSICSSGMINGFRVRWSKYGDTLPTCFSRIMSRLSQVDLMKINDLIIGS